MIRVYEKTAAREGFRFFGNVKVGHDIEVEDLERLYHAIVYTVGCETDRQLGIPGEDLPGSHAATAFVGWYNAHPDYCDEEFDLSCERAVVIGNGNVAMDVARMLALTDHELRQTDTADHAIERLDAKRDPRDRRPRPPRAGAGRLHQPGDQGARRDGGRRRDRRPVRGRARPGQRGLPRLRRGRQDDQGQRRDAARVLPARRPRASGSGSSCASSPRRSRSRARAGSRRS